MASSVPHQTCLNSHCWLCSHPLLFNQNGDKPVSCIRLVLGNMQYKQLPQKLNYGFKSNAALADPESLGMLRRFPPPTANSSPLFCITNCFSVCGTERGGSDTYSPPSIFCISLPQCASLYSLFLSCLHPVPEADFHHFQQLTTLSVK